MSRLKIVLLLAGLAVAGALFARSGLTYADIPPCPPPFHCGN